VQCALSDFRCYPIVMFALASTAGWILAAEAIDPDNSCKNFHAQVTELMESALEYNKHCDAAITPTSSTRH
jgi:hypothetical protein